MENNKIVIKRCSSCAVCGKELSDPASVSIGIGPECIKDIPLDKEEIAKALIEKGVFEMAYYDNPTLFEFHKRISSQGIINLDKDLAPIVKTTRRLSAEPLVKFLEDYPMSFCSDTNASDTRGTALKNKILLIRKSVLEGIHSLAVSSPNPEKVANIGTEYVSKLKTMINLERRYNESIAKLSVIKLKKTGASLFNKNDFVNVLEMWQEKMDRNASTYAQSFISNLKTEDERKNGFHTRNLLINMDDRAATLDKEIWDRSKREKESKSAERIQIISRGIFNGDINEIFLALEGEGLSESVELFKSREKDFLKKYIPQLEKVVMDRDFSSVGSNVKQMLAIGKIVDEGKDPHDFAKYILSSPEIVDSIKTAIDKEGKDWGAELRRLYGFLKANGLWEISTGKQSYGA